MFNYFEQLKIIKQIHMVEGDRRVLTCPFCGGRNKFSITKNEDGVTLWNCYRASCEVKGSYRGKRSAEALKRSIGKIPVVQEQPKIYPLPKITKNIINDEKALQYVTQYNCLEAYQAGLISIRYSPALKRVLFYNQDSTGAVGRSLIGHQAKWWTYGSVVGGIHVGNGSTAVLVEDVPSACSVARIPGVTGVALLGTSITEPIKMSIKDYFDIYIILDNDASNKVISLAKALANGAKVRITKDDLKCLSVPEIVSVMQ